MAATKCGSTTTAGERYEIPLLPAFHSCSTAVHLLMVKIGDAKRLH
ncbi:hypothetical protein DICVIV_11998 [Dictyocaulus viviparus]|uniref:Uncharacterized protein n=1 Tax=Dictyocaulus viviparus TaxID=29172 RepID=A0A0D8XBN1_DICVI|nr:hypothetical protein DICVIV_11998 [Dictyocaulus viviparus]